MNLKKGCVPPILKYMSVYMRKCISLYSAWLVYMSSIRLYRAYLYSGRGKYDPNTPMENTLKNAETWGYIIMLVQGGTTLVQKKYERSKNYFCNLLFMVHIFLSSDSSPSNEVIYPISIANAIFSSMLARCFSSVLVPVFLTPLSWRPKAI